MFRQSLFRRFSSGGDLYKILGVSKSSSQEDIKQAYRKLALRWHPDRNAANRVEAEKKFKEISEAYQVLSDVEKRRDYDQPQQTPFQRGPPGGGAGFRQSPHQTGGAQFHHMDMREAEELFRQMFGGGGGNGRGSVFGSFDFFGGGMGGMGPGMGRQAGTTQVTEQMIMKNGRRFLKITKVTNRPDGSTTTEINETPID
jgi:DnaJ-class molecular chaperone